MNSLCTSKIKEGYKFKDLIKNTLFELHNKPQTQKLIKNPIKHSKRRFLHKKPRSFQSFTTVAKTPSQKSDRFPNNCYKIVVRKFSIYKVKQMKAKRVKN